MSEMSKKSRLAQENVKGRGVHKVSRWYRRVSRPTSERSQRTLSVAPYFLQSWWHMGNSGDKPVMQIVAHWHVTNLRPDSVIGILRCQLRFKGSDTKHEGQVLIEKPDRPWSAKHGIPSGKTRDVSTDFLVMPPICEAGENIEVQLILTDQLGNEQETEFVTLRCK